MPHVFILPKECGQVFKGFLQTQPRLRGNSEERQNVRRGFSRGMDANWVDDAERMCQAPTQLKIPRLDIRVRNDHCQDGNNRVERRQNL